MDNAPPRSPAAIRRAIRRRWEADGRPPCPICHTPIADDEPSYASSDRFNAVVHRLCSMVSGASVMMAEQCRKIREGLDPTEDPCRQPKFCPCPFSTAINAVVFARRIDLPIIEAPTSGSAACVREAEQAGVGTRYQGVSHRDVYGDVPQGVFLVDQAAWDRPSDWYEPPATLILDVARSFQEGRITACVPQNEAREVWQLMLDGVPDLPDQAN